MKRNIYGLMIILAVVAGCSLVNPDTQSGLQAKTPKDTVVATPYKGYFPLIYSDAEGFYLPGPTNTPPDASPAIINIFLLNLKNA